MADVDGALILSILQRMQSDLSDVKHDVHDLKVRITIVDGHIGSLIVSNQLINERLDRLQGDMTRVKRRLDLVDAD